MAKATIGKLAVRGVGDAVGHLMLGPIRELPSRPLRRMALIASVRALRGAGFVVPDAVFVRAEQLCDAGPPKRPDENDLARAGRLPRDPEEDARPMRAKPGKGGAAQVSSLKPSKPAKSDAPGAPAFRPHWWRKRREDPRRADEVHESRRRG